MFRPTLLALIVAFALLVSPAAHADVTTSGGASFQTGVPTPTLQITAPISLSINTTGTAFFLVFDQWTNGNGTTDGVSADPATQNLSFTLGNNAGSTTINALYDSYYTTYNDLRPGDGLLSFNALDVSAGQTLVLQPGTFTFGHDGGFDPSVPLVFTGNVFLADSGGFALSALTSVSNVPEPATWAAVGVGAVALSVVGLRRRAAVAT